MNKRGQIMIQLMMFVIAIGVAFALIPVIKVFVDMQQQSNNLNCYGYIYNGNVNHSLSFNSTLNAGNSGSPLGCTAIKLYIPYILLVILIYGMQRVLYNQFAQDSGGIG